MGAATAILQSRRSPPRPVGFTALRSVNRSAVSQGPARQREMEIPTLPISGCGKSAKLREALPVPVGAEWENRRVWPARPGGVPALEPGVPSLEKHLDGAQARCVQTLVERNGNVRHLHAGR